MLLPNYVINTGHTKIEAFNIYMTVKSYYYDNNYTLVKIWPWNKFKSKNKQKNALQAKKRFAIYTLTH